MGSKALLIHLDALSYNILQIRREGKSFRIYVIIINHLEGQEFHPREASRHHSETSSSVLKRSLKEANILIKDVDIIAYSAGPGLGPCLRVGAVVARTLATFHNKPLIPVNHALGHIELGAMLPGCLSIPYWWSLVAMP